MTKPNTFRRVTRIEEAARIFYQSLNLSRLDAESLPTQDGLGRVLAADVVAPADIPSADQSAVDGYAVLAKDTFSASLGNPALLRVSSSGSVFDTILKDGEALYVYTGSPIPQGADAVVMIEFTEKTDIGSIEICKAVAPGEDVSWKGEDVKKDETVLRDGTRLQPQDLGMLAAMGYQLIQVYRKPLVGILATGSELAPLGSEKRRGQVTDVNSIILSAMVTHHGGTPLRLGSVEDDLQQIKSRIMKGLEKCDLLIISGGTSEGQADLTVKAIDSLGKPGVVVHGIAMRPGRPTALASLHGKPIINLSGYPVAAMIGFYVFGKPLLSRMLRTTDEPWPCVRARATRRMASSSGLRSHVRVAVSRRGGELVADPVRSTGSGIISSMTKANGLVVIPEDVEGVDENEEVDVFLFRPLEQKRGEGA